VNLATNRRAAQKNVERFSDLKLQFLELMTRFRRTTDPVERRRFIQVGYSLSHEAQCLCEQHRYELSETAKKFAEFQPKTTGESKAGRPKRKAKIVPFRHLSHARS
jgi:hypothetical protein